MVLKAVHEDLQISEQAMRVMDQFLHDMLERLASEAGRLSRHRKRKTMQSREVQSAVRMILSGELSQHAISEGRKAVIKFIHH